MSEVADLIYDGAYDRGCELIATYVDKPKTYEWPDIAGVWTGDYSNDYMGAFVEGMEVETDELSVTYQYRSPDDDDLTTCDLGDGVAYTILSGSVVAVFSGRELHISCVEGDNNLDILGALVQIEAVSLADALEAIEEDEDFDEQDLILFKVKYA